MKNPGLLFALLLPGFSLGTLTGYKAFKRQAGAVVRLPITGYDPRDLLSGHYLTYRLDLPGAICETDADPVFICIDGEDGETSFTVPDLAEGSCKAILRARCEYGRVLAGVERFYVPEDRATELDRIVRGWGQNRARTKLELAVDRQGRATIRELLIDDKPWREALR